MGGLHSRQELIEGQTRLFEDVGKGRTQDRLVCGNCDLHRLAARQVPLQPDVASFLAYDHEPGALKRGDDPVVGKARDLRHNAIFSMIESG